MQTESEGQTWGFAVRRAEQSGDSVCVILLCLLHLNEYVLSNSEGRQEVCPQTQLHSLAKFCLPSCPLLLPSPPALPSCPPLLPSPSPSSVAPSAPLQFPLPFPYGWGDLSSLTECAVPCTSVSPSGTSSPKPAKNLDPIPQLFSGVSSMTHREFWVSH